MPVVTTVFEFFLLLQSGVNVVYRFRTVQSRCFAHSQKRVYVPLQQRFERFIRFLHRYAVPTGRNAGPRSCIRGKNAYCCAVCTYVCCAVVYVYVCMCVFCTCVCVWPYVRLCSISAVFFTFFGNLFGISTNDPPFHWLF